MNQYPQQGYPQQGYPGMSPQPQQPPPPGVNVGRIVIGVVVGVIVVGAVLLVVVRRGLNENIATYTPMSPSEQQRLLTPPPPREVVVVDEFTTLPDGQEQTWKVPPGTYRVEMTATSKGASLVWTGAPCEGAKKETSSFTSTCTVTQTSQLTVRNPSLLGLGGSTTITLKVTKLP